MGYVFRHRRRVEFSETDMVGIVHFSNFFRYAEAAETAMYRALGISVTQGDITFPRVHAEFDFRKPLRFEEEFDVVVEVEEVRSRSLAYAFRVENLSGEACARGKLVVACVRKDPATGALASVAVPARMAELMRTPAAI
jgi:YbgC/YbaW family acyl-CoA thioester hydrolase